MGSPVTTQAAHTMLLAPPFMLLLSLLFIPLPSSTQPTIPIELAVGGIQLIALTADQATFLCHFRCYWSRRLLCCEQYQHCGHCWYRPCHYTTNEQQPTCNNWQEEKGHFTAIHQN